MSGKKKKRVQPSIRNEEGKKPNAKDVAKPKPASKTENPPTLVNPACWT
jgi:hypothetical protein